MGDATACDGKILFSALSSPVYEKGFGQMASEGPSNLADINIGEGGPMWCFSEGWNCPSEGRGNLSGILTTFPLNHCGLDLPQQRGRGFAAPDFLRRTRFSLLKLFSPCQEARLQSL